MKTKRNKIIASVIIVLGIAWMGAAWMTGKQIENLMDEHIKRTNNSLDDFLLGSRLKLSYQNYQRGLFSSRVDVIMQARSQTEDNAFLKPGQRIILTETIHHGPFPLVQLKKFDLMPRMASVHSELENTEVIKTLFANAKGVSFFQADTRINFSGATSSTITLLPMSYQHTNINPSFSWDGGTLKIDTDVHGDKVSFQGYIGNMTVDYKNQQGMPVVLTLNGVKVTANTRANRENFQLGEKAFSLQNITASVEGQDAVTMEGLNGNIQDDQTHQMLSSLMNLTLDNFKMHNQSLGQMALSVKTSQIDSQALKMLLEQNNMPLSALLNQSENNDDALNTQTRLSFANAFTALLKSEPNIVVAPFTWKNDKGESQFTFTVKFSDPNKEKTENSSLPLESMLKSADGTLIISMDMANELCKRIALAEGNTPEYAKRIAAQQVETLANIGQLFKLMTKKDNNLVTNLHYSAGQVIFNGESIPFKQFLSLYLP